MKKQKNPAWSAARSEEIYGFRRWGGEHFFADEAGFVRVAPLADERSIRILDVVEEARSKGYDAPMVVRFQDLLRHRVIQLNEAFRTAIAEEKYDARYRGVFPIKVNQLREVVEEVLDAGDPYQYGLEAGSKPELMIALALHDDNRKIIVCNGYKDREYIRLALLGNRLGKPVILVIEQINELREVLRLAGETGTRPMIGLRVKLNTRGEGKWATSTGDSAKFGLTALEILSACNEIRREGYEDCLRLLHFHIGSQVPNIITIKNAVTEAARVYVQLARMGFPMGFLDVGGGLGIDYDGSRTNFESSMNYSLEEYARDVVFNVREICVGSKVPVPDLVSESGRAVAAPHSILVVEVFDRITRQTALPPVDPEKPTPKVVSDLEHILNSSRGYGRLERFHDAVQKKEEAFSLFNLGYLDLESRARAEALFWQIARQIDQQVRKSRGYLPEELLELKGMLADQYVCNFSVFQSLLDHWALKQLFPISPLHRLNEKPTVNAILADITCDSDGKISQFIDLQDVRDHLPLHPLNGKPYYLAIYLVGAYQDIMGDLHNLFGRVNEVHVFLDEDEEDGFYIEETIAGNRVADVLQGVQFKPDEIVRMLKRQVDRAIKQDLVKPREGIRLLEFYENLMQEKTYLKTIDLAKPGARKRTRRPAAAR
ncbi:MAG: biosynthetic arginine decarboxylase [Puniceicoccaceae bacterium]|nr:MAG: biosynthetic arginine decarboxylase [Puniceicoccaceae bacterium]